MFLRAVSIDSSDGRFPRVSGDVSEAQRSAEFESQFSPRERGCFHNRLALGLANNVFPA